MHALLGEVLYRNAQLRGGARDVRDGRGEVHGTAEWRHQRCGRHAEEWRRMNRRRDCVVAGKYGIVHRRCHIQNANVCYH